MNGPNNNRSASTPPDDRDARAVPDSESLLQKPPDAAQTKTTRERLAEYRAKLASFWREEMRGEYPGKTPAPTAPSSGEPSIALETIEKISRDWADYYKLPLAGRVARIASQELFEFTEERAIIKEFSDAVKAAEKEPTLEAEMGALSEARATLKERIEESNLIPEHQKWELLHKLSDLALEHDGRLRVAEDIALDDVKNAIVQYVEAKDDEVKVMTELKMTIHGFASSTGEPHGFSYSITRKLTLGIKSLRHIRDGIKAYREKKRAA